MALSNQSDLLAFFEMMAPQKVNLLNLLKGFDDTSSLSHLPGTSDSLWSQAGIFQIDFPRAENSRTVTLVGPSHLRNPENLKGAQV
jgi:hypothetical protein